jgi:hypothetical protein
MNKNIKKCPICGLDVNKNYFSFPKLPSYSSFALIYGDTHINCLYSHPQKKEIQNELTKIYLQIFTNHLYNPIVAQLNCILIKVRLDQQILEVYDFEDFVNFYIPYNQIEDIVNLQSNQELAIGVNQWISILVKPLGQLKIISYLPKEERYTVELDFLNFKKLKKIVIEAYTKINYIS